MPIRAAAWQEAFFVHPSPTRRPHYLERLGPERGVYVPVGSTNRRADATLIEELRSYSRNETLDEQPMPGLESEAIDFRAASESFADRRTPDAAIWRPVRVLAGYQGRLVPAVGGILPFGRDRDTGRTPTSSEDTGRTPTSSAGRGACLSPNPRRRACRT